MKKILKIILILFIMINVYSVEPNLPRHSVIQYIDNVQSTKVEIYNINISTLPIKIIDKTKKPRFFMIQNDTNYDLYISTSSSFSTYFIIPSRTIFYSNYLIDIFGKFENSSNIINIILER